MDHKNADISRRAAYSPVSLNRRAHILFFFQGEENMVFHPSRTVILLLFVGFLMSIQLENVLGLRSSDIALRHSHKDQRILQQNQHTVKATEELLNTKKSSEHSNKGLDPTKKNSANFNHEFDPNQSNKRRVPRGSDPIHNRT
ncbi:hypothetical protein VNO78_09233 [Psophocarpus tetragonolobus]|uniref:CLAVATA3/ESR (CLE)-related protein 45 n=1 Tax=Psophocarpus tetragonolobus TaxID=3891 RepID=A0AAN9SXA8_PSOTE